MSSVVHRSIRFINKSTRIFTAIHNSTRIQFINNSSPITRYTIPSMGISTTPQRIYHNTVKSSHHTTINSSQLPDIPLFQNALKYLDNTAIVSNNTSYTYYRLLHDSLCMKQYLIDTTKSNNNDLNETSISYLHDGSYEYVVIQWGIWLSGGIAIPLHSSLPPPQQQFLVHNSETKLLLVQDKYYDGTKTSFQTNNVTITKFDLSSIRTQYSPQLGSIQNTPINMSRRAMLIYTSGTTGQPKGVVSTHKMINAQTSSLITAWHWSSNDAILHVLPLHHVHGVINALACPLYTGAKVYFQPKFDPQIVWNKFADLVDLTVFTAVPTIYSKLIQYYDECDKPTQQRFSAACKKFRLFMCGSAALPGATLDRWKSISGHILLERYGMTECGMALSNSYEVDKRRIGYVGQPLPGVQTKIQYTNDNAENDKSGQLLLRGDNVFSEYWRLPDATQKEFTSDGWFMTGDIVECDADGNYKIVGRASVDIIKSAGNKVSSLEIEQVLLTHPNIHEAAVVGVADDEYGQLVSAIVVLKNTADKLTVDELRVWCKSRLQTAEIPRKLLIVDSIPRNAMGKVNKKQLVKLFDQ